MKKPGSICVLLGTILIVSLLIQSVCIVRAEADANATTTNENATTTGNASVNITDDANYSQTLSWVLLLPLFLGGFLFLGWICRYFEEMTECFVYFVSLFPAILAISVLIFFPNSSKDNLPILISAISLILISAYLIYYVRKTLGNDTITKIINLKIFLKRVRNIYIIGVVFIWPFILIYSCVYHIKYFTLNGFYNLTFPVYIITASFIGVLSYLLISIGETYSQIVPEYKKLSIVWSYLRRILIAPFIAIIGFYLLYFLPNQPKDLDTIDNHFLFVFSFFAGVFTKSVEDWIYAGVKKLLPGDKLKEIQSRTQYDVKRADFVKKLRLDEDLVYILYDLRIRTIEDLASYDLNELVEKVNMKASLPDPDSGIPDIETKNQDNKQADGRKEGPEKSQDNKKIKYSKYSKQQLQACINKAQLYMGIDESELIITLKMDRDSAFKLSYFADIKTIEDLCNKKLEDIYRKLDDSGIKLNKEVIEGYVKEAKKLSANFNASCVKGVAPLSVTFKDTSTGATTYAWDFGDGNKTIEENPIHTFTTAGDYNVVLAVSDGKGNSSTKTMKITVTPVPIAADFDTVKSCDAEPLKVQFTDKSKGATSWKWDFGDITSTEQNPSHTFPKAGNYVVTLTVSDGTNSASKTVTISIEGSDKLD